MERLVETVKKQWWNGEITPWLELVVAVELGERTANYWLKGYRYLI